MAKKKKQKNEVITWVIDNKFWLLGLLVLSIFVFVMATANSKGFGEPCLADFQCADQSINYPNGEIGTVKSACCDIPIPGSSKNKHCYSLYECEDGFLHI